MSYELSFTENFFTGFNLDPDRSDKPTSVLQALVSLPDKAYLTICREVLSYNSDFVDDTLRDSCKEIYGDIIKEIRAVNTCSTLTSPVEVWLDVEGCFTVLVYRTAETSILPNGIHV